MKRHTQQDLATVTPAGGQEIAVIGIAGRFPKADDVDAFWRNISTGTECFTEFTDEELIQAGEDPKIFRHPDYVRSRGVLNDIRGADAGLFGISPREATLADPQQLIFSEIVWEVLESSGYGTPDDRGVVGVFAGMNISTYLLTRPNAFRMGVATDALMVGNDKDALATNVAYRLDLRGPSVSVQTFCSTSLVAIHLACASVRRGECDIALAGGVSIRVPDRTGYLYHEGDQASPDGHVRTFDAGARGTMYGDGAAVVALKRLDKAVADRDTVLAVIRGSAINNDGALKFSFQAPSIEGQRRCVTAAIADAGVDPQAISYVEAHGTATEVGDPMEVAALTGAFGPTAEKQYCLLGSVKPNIGHLDRASGATGLIKVVQSLRHELIPGTLNYTSPNPEIDFAGSPFRVTSEHTPWPRRADRPRIAGLSSLGTGGTNVHAIISEAPEPAPRAERRRRWQVLPVSARSKQAAEKWCANLADRLVTEPDLDLGDVAYTMQAGRKTFNHRRVVIADSTAGAVEALSDVTAQLSRTDATIGRQVGLLIAGVGEQYPGMVAALYADEPGFREDVDECLQLMGLTGAAQLSDMFVPAEQAGDAAGSGAGTAGGSLAALMGRVDTDQSAANRPVQNPHLIQPAVFVAEYALARLLARWGVQPDVMIGYSLGEYVAACLSGVLSLPDALRLVAYRAKLIASLPEGAMLAVAADEQALGGILGDALRDLDMAVRTGSQLVLAGPCDLIDAAAVSLREAGIGCRRLETTHAFHSRMLAPVAAELTDWITDNVTLKAPSIPYISNVTGEPVTEEMVADPGYWARHMCETVEFGEGLAHVLRSGDLALVEVGPGRSLGALTRGHSDCVPNQWPLIVATLPGASEHRDVHAALAETVGKLWLAGVSIDWAGLHASMDTASVTDDASDSAGENVWLPGRVPLPTYPFERQDYWLEADLSGFGESAGTFDENDPTTALTGLPRLPDARWINLPIWKQANRRPARTEAAHWLVFTDSGAADTLAAPLLDHLASVGAQVTLARPGDRFASEPEGFVLRPGSTEDSTAALRELIERGQPPERVVHLWSVGRETSGDDAATSLQRGVHSLVAFARTAGELGLEGWSLDVVTSGGQRVLGGEAIRPELGTLLGPVRLIPVEYPRVRTRLVDVEASDTGVSDDAPDDASSRALLAELRAEPVDQVVALRAGRRWIPDYEVLDEACDAGATPAVEIRHGGTYLVTGGLGGIGLAMAERLAQDYQARLVLMGRTPVPPSDQWGQILAAASTTSEVRRRLDGLQRLTASGAEVVTVTGDVSQVEDVRRAVGTALERFGELNGVLHCAGVPAVGMMQFKTAADIEKVLAPKMAGALALAEALKDVPTDFIALFSSTTSATGGGAGQVDYCSANAFLDAFAASDPLPGCLVTSLDWGEWVWNGWTTGLDSYDDGTKKFFEEYRQKFGITFDQGWQTLRRVLASGERHVIVSTQDFAPLVAMSRRSSIESLQSVVKKARGALGRHPRPDLSTAYVDPQSPAEETIAAVWAEALGLEQVGIHDNFFELGGNSLIGMEIIADARKALGVPYLPPHLLYQAPTVATLAAEAMSGRKQDTEEDRHAVGAIDLRRSRIEQRRSTLRQGRTP